MAGEMNPRERWGLLLIDEFPDRPPVYPLITSHSADIYGCGVDKYCTNGDILADSQLKAQEIYGHDGLSVFSDVGIIAEAMGSTYHISISEVPILNRPIIKDISAIGSLKVPDPGSSGRMPVYLKAIDKMYNAAGDYLPIFAYVPCPFTTAAGLRGVDEFLMDTIMEPAAVHDLLEISLQAAIRFCDECILAGALPILVDPLASGSVISRKTFSEFALSYNKRLISYLHRYDLDITLHICGDTSSIYDLIPETGADLFSLDQLDLSTAVNKIGDSLRLVGNLSPNKLLASSEMPIDHECSRIIENGISNKKGFVFSTGCEVPIRLDRSKLETFIRLGKDMRYDKK
jgi:uroporphyrinogen decarboxylase